MVYGVCMLYRIWCIDPVEPPWLARGGSIAPVEPPLATGMCYAKTDCMINVRIRALFGLCRCFFDDCRVLSTGNLSCSSCETP